MNPEHRLDDVTKAKLLLVALSFAWGLNWPSIRIGLEELTPWTFRLIGFTVSSLSLIAIVKLQGRSLAVPRGIAWLHIAVSSTLNVVAFGLFGTFAQLATTTSRVVIVAYSFPVWASLLAWLILGESSGPHRRSASCYASRGSASWSIRCCRRRRLRSGFCSRSAPRWSGRRERST